MSSKTSIFMPDLDGIALAVAEIVKDAPRLLGRRHRLASVARGFAF